MHKEKESWNVCKFCIAMKGLKGSDLFDEKCSYAFKTENNLFKHMRDEHDIIIKDWDYEKGCLNTPREG